MIWKFTITIVVLIALVLLFAATKPKTFRIQRSINIDAPPDKISALIDDLHNWDQWAPQDKEDSSVTRTYSGPAHGAGAVSEWAGSGKAGRGRMLITESIPSTRISIQVDWVKPFAARNMNEFILESTGLSTKVTWAMHGPNVYILKVMSVFVNMDRMMGRHFETGLANLKAAAEHGAK
jgi:Polyketide cyclase / dehydrase and lipid transport